MFAFPKWDLLPQINFFPWFDDFMIRIDDVVNGDISLPEISSCSTHFPAFLRHFNNFVKGILKHLCRTHNNLLAHFTASLFYNVVN